MALHNPVEDAQREAFQRNPRGRQALDVARAFLEAPDDDDRVPRRLPVQAAPIAGQRAFGRRGVVQQRRQPTVGAPTPVPGGAPVTARQSDGFGPGNVTAPSPLRVFLGGSEQPNRDLLRRVMQKVFQTQGGRF